jgi:cellulose synthase/poly-beta-1,6-N-acetylglucosamine synthase-like glycosyltransferase
MRLAEITFWLSAGLLFYAWVGYPLLVGLGAMLVQTAGDRRYMLDRRERRRQPPRAWPSVTICIAAHNEAGRLAAQLDSLRRLDYPIWQAIYVLDGCSDGTAAELAGQPEVMILEQPRQGKARALAQARERADGAVLVLTDAGTRLAPDTLRMLARHFADPRVGAVCGAVQLDSPPGAPRLERLYWRWESALRALESRLQVTVTASGALLAVRRSCFPALPAGTVVEDMEVPLRIRAAGYRVLYDPEARAWDEAAGSLAAESRRRQRLSRGGWQTLLHVWGLPLGLRQRWALFSHKVLRWLTPGLAGLLLVSNLLLLSVPAYRVLAECAGLFLAGLAVWDWRQPQGNRWLVYGAAMSWALLRGLWPRTSSRIDLSPAYKQRHRGAL